MLIRTKVWEWDRSDDTVDARHLVQRLRVIGVRSIRGAPLHASTTTTRATQYALVLLANASLARRPARLSTAVSEPVGLASIAVPTWRVQAVFAARKRSNVQRHTASTAECTQSGRQTSGVDGDWGCM